MSAKDNNSEVFSYFKKVKGDFRARCHTIGSKSVVQLLLTYGPLYKNATTRGPLPIKWCSL